jgi:hypothetical protein
MKKLLFLMVALVFISYSQAYADYSYSFNFVDNSDLYSIQGSLISPSNGNGTYTLTGGSVVGTGLDNSGLIYSLVPVGPGGSIRPFGATDLIADNQFAPASSDNFIPGQGFTFQNGSGLSATYLNIWGNGNGSYTIFQLGYDTATQTEIYGPQDNGTGTLTATPIPAAAWLFGSGLIGLLGTRRKLS